ncbi:type III secretion system inner membrane ring lipoprotein SctJ [Desulfovibrio inopinatus]|uniref:type III secretion system inner membrane ring lipoprotein SctJ n=1 Tax=Desulfovibrio inopinatus TaxID=102109 RepID=UPI00040ECDE5|nr:type III secretion inner membrane ring lipoprotein SctJ [Desulfovibrio inopinatus]
MSRTTGRKHVCLALIVLVCLLLAGCKVELYSDVEEREANEMLTALMSSGVDATKTATKKGKWTVMVEEAELPRAMMLLEQKGLPRPTYENVIEVFKQQGMISSPMVEQAKYIYALSQEVAATIADLDGVLVARVHLVLPKVDEITEKLIPASASVFVKYAYSADIPARVHDIKKLVQFSIPELSFDKVSVFLFPSDQGQLFHLPPPMEYVSVLGLRVRPGDAPMAWGVFGTAALFLVLTGVLAVILLKMRRKSGA